MPVIGKKTLQELLGIVEHPLTIGAVFGEPEIIEYGRRRLKILATELRRALKPKRSVVLHRQRKIQKRIDKNAETARIHSEVFTRANGRCECGGNCGRRANVLDHFFGRKNAEQSMTTCWALSLKCDDDKTHNRPSALHWVTLFVAHQTKYGYLTTQAEAKAAWLAAKEQFKRDAEARWHG